MADEECPINDTTATTTIDIGTGVPAESATESDNHTGSGVESSTQSDNHKGSDVESATQSDNHKGSDVESATQSDNHKGSDVESATQSDNHKGSDVESATQSDNHKGSDVESATQSDNHKGSDVESATQSDNHKGSDVESATQSDNHKGSDVESATQSDNHKGSDIESATQSDNHNVPETEHIVDTNNEHETERETKDHILQQEPLIHSNNIHIESSPEVELGPNDQKDTHHDEISCVEIMIPLPVLDAWKQIPEGKTASFSGNCQNQCDNANVSITATRSQGIFLSLQSHSIQETFQQTISSIWKCSIAADVPSESVEKEVHEKPEKDDSEVIVVKRKRGRPRKLPVLESIKKELENNAQLPKKRRRRPTSKDLNQERKQSMANSENDQVSCELENASKDEDKVETKGENLEDVNDKVEASQELADDTDFSVWKATDKKFKKKKVTSIAKENQQMESSDRPNVKTRLKSDRALNRTLYKLNVKVAKDMALAVPEGGQVCVICSETLAKANWNLLIHLRRFHLMESKEYYDLLKCSPEEREDKLVKLKSLESKPGKVHAPKMAGSLPCCFCGESFLGIRNMKRHLHLVHRQEMDLEDVIAHFTKEYANLIHKNRMISIRKENLTQTEYPCCYCGMKLSMACTRSKHQMYTCPKNPNRKQRVHCTYCGTAFKTKEARDIHMKKHAEHDFKWVCDLCGKELKTKALMYEHKLKDHSGKPPRFPCTLCEMGFHYKDQLAKHITKHSSVRDVMCDFCGKMFKKAADMRRHKKQIHDRKFPFHCHFCGHGVSKRSYLETHKCGRTRRPKEDISKAATNFVNTGMLKSEDSDITNAEVVYSIDSGVNGQDSMYTTSSYAKSDNMHEQSIVIKSLEANTEYVLPSSVSTTADPAYCPSQANVVQYVTVDQTVHNNYVMQTLQPPPTTTVNYQSVPQYSDISGSSTVPFSIYPMYNPGSIAVPQPIIQNISQASFVMPDSTTVLQTSANIPTSQDHHTLQNNVVATGHTVPPVETVLAKKRQPQANVSFDVTTGTLDQETMK